MFNADDKCEHCGQDFADHNYVRNSIDKYECPHPRVESYYGHFAGDDPTLFHPDGECC